MNTTKQTEAILELENEIVRFFVYKPEFSREYMAGTDIEDFYFPHTQKIFEAVQEKFMSGTKINKTIIVQEILKDSNAVSCLEIPPSVATDEIKQYVEKLKDTSSKRQISSYLEQGKIDISKRISARTFAGASIDFFRAVIQGTTSFETQAVTIGAYIDTHRKILDEVRSGKQTGVPTGLDLLDNYLAGGLKRGDLVLIGARPSIGKTSFSLTMAYNAAKAGAKVLFVSVEMKAKDIVDRLLSFETGLPLTEIVRGEHASAVEEAYKRFSTLQFKIVEGSSFTSRDVTAIATREKYVDGLDLVVVDYLQYLADGAKGQNDSVRVGRISRNLKSLASSLNVPVVSPSQLSRRPEHRTGTSHGVPSLEDLRDSGSLEQDADVVMLLHRKDDEPSRAVMRIAKNRKGETGAINLVFNEQTTMFEEAKLDSI